MWAFLVGLFAGRGLASSRLPDAEKQRRFDDRQAARAGRKDERRATRAGWGPIQWMIVFAVAVGIVVLFRL